MFNNDMKKGFSSYVANLFYFKISPNDHKSQREKRIKDAFFFIKGHTSLDIMKVEVSSS